MVINIPYPVIDTKKTGENIKRLREEHNISVIDIQQFLGLANPQAIYQWQRGINLPTVDHLCALSHLFGISMNEILVLKDGLVGSEAEVIRPTKEMTMATNKMLLMMAA